MGKLFSGLDWQKTVNHIYKCLKRTKLSGFGLLGMKLIISYEGCEWADFIQGELHVSNTCQADGSHVMKTASGGPLIQNHINFLSHLYFQTQSACSFLHVERLPEARACRLRCAVYYLLAGWWEYWSKKSVDKDWNACAPSTHTHLHTHNVHYIHRHEQCFT